MFQRFELHFHMNLNVVIEGIRYRFLMPVKLLEYNQRFIVGVQVRCRVLAANNLMVGI